MSRFPADSASGAPVTLLAVHAARRRAGTRGRGKGSDVEAVPTILVVDDDADIRDAMCLILEHNGYRAMAASNGEEALRVLRAGRPVDLILLDMMMPVMDGWGFRTSQPDGPAFVKIPVIVLTGDGRASAKAAAIGAVAYLKKPLDIDEFLALVARRCAPT